MSATRSVTSVRNITYLTSLDRRSLIFRFLILFSFTRLAAIMGGLPETLSGFAVIPAIYSKDATHILYAKQHGAQKKAGRAVPDVLPKDRTMFLVNVPPDATERELTLFFKPDGIVEKVVFDQIAAEDANKLSSPPDIAGYRILRLARTSRSPLGPSMRKAVNDLGLGA